MYYLCDVFYAINNFLLECHDPNRFRITILASIIMAGNRRLAEPYFCRSPTPLDHGWVGIDGTPGDRKEAIFDHFRITSVPNIVAEKCARQTPVAVDPTGISPAHLPGSAIGAPTPPSNVFLRQGQQPSIQDTVSG